MVLRDVDPTLVVSILRVVVQVLALALDQGRASGKLQVPHPVTRKESPSSSGPKKMGVRPVAETQVCLRGSYLSKDNEILSNDRVRRVTVCRVSGKNAVMSS